MRAPTPTVSIGMPVYNGQRYLAEAVDSLLAQTFTDFELIISDNASTDATPDICRRYARRDCRIRFVRHEQNRGAIWNFNHVIQLARGSYARWHAHDDVCAPTFLRQCVDLLESDPTYVMCHTQKARIDAQGHVCGVLSQQADGAADGAESYADRIRRGRQSHRPHERYRTVLLGPSFCLDCFGLIRTSALRRTRLILPCYGSEKILSAELALLGRCGHVPEPLFFVRDHAADADARTSAAQQQQYVGSAAPRRFSPTRLKLLWGHATAIRHVRLPAAERARCLAAVLQYIAQLPKWKRVVKELFAGGPIRSAERTTLAAPPEPVTVGQWLGQQRSVGR